MKRNQAEKKRISAAVLGCSLIFLSGCGSLADTLVRQAGSYASGKKEEAYYLQPALYRMKDLMEDYTSDIWYPAWETGGAIRSDEPEGWERKTAVCSDACISSSRELEEVLAEAMETAALGAELHFDRSGYLPGADVMPEWTELYVNSHPVESLCLEAVTEYQKETASERVIYLIFSYDRGRGEVRNLRKQVEEEAAAFAGSADMKALSQKEQTEAVWERLTKQVRYPDEEEQTPSCRRADGALLAECAVGQGYAAGAKVLLDAFGIENEILAEKREEADGRYRFYNRVKLDDVWYRMDCCFGAAADGNRDFFLKEEKAAEED